LADKQETKAPLAEKKESKPVEKSEKKERKGPNFIQRYYRETMGELRKVTWPSRTEAINMTVLVVIVLIFMAILLGVIVDGFASVLMKAIIG
jgi:preprotein translocase subunit SecE